MKPFLILLFVISISLSLTSAQVITIAEAIEDLNGDFIPDRLGDTVTVQGVVYSPNYGGYYTNYFIDDGTAGTHFFYTPDIILNFNLGDKVEITGFVDQYYGSSEIAGLDTTSITLISTGNPLPDPIVLTLAQYFTDPEAYEGSLIGFTSLSMVGGAWPSPGNSATVQISDGIDTLDMFIDSDTDVDDNPEPTWPKDIIGIGQQYSTSTPPNDDYCLWARYYSDFLPPTQNSLTHSTGTLEVTIIDNGYIGNDHSGTFGGVVFNGNPNAMPGSAGAGLIFGQNGEGYGQYALIFEDFYNVIPIAGFFSTPYFNQYANYTVALLGNPDSRTMVESLSYTGQDFVFLRANISNNTMNIDDLYPGIFADWDIGNFPLNRGGYDPTRNLFYMYENGGAGDASYYGIMGIAVDGVPMAPNTMMGTITESVAWDRFALYNYMTSTAFDPITTDGDYRMYTCAGPFSFSVGSTLVVDIAIVAGTSLADLLDNADEAILYGQYVPVELTSFTAASLSGKVMLNWTTASEINNLGFEMERKIINNNKEGEWVRIAFIEGHGTTTEPKEYSYVDNIKSITATSLAYRLKQLDFHGSYEYSDEVFVENPAPLDFALHQNYPNPFNPTTKIKYSIPVISDVVLKVFNILGTEVFVLVNQKKEAGQHLVEFDASALPSGVYFYKLQVGDFVETKKMILIK